MATPTQITFRHMEHSATLEQEIRNRTAELEDRFTRIVGCRVVVDAPSSHHRKGLPFQVRIELQLEHGGTMVCDGRDLSRAHEDAYTAVKDVFASAERLLAEGEHGHGRSSLRRPKRVARPVERGNARRTS